MSWQIEKTAKRCQSCDSDIEIGRPYFSALFLNLLISAEAGQPAPEQKPELPSQRLLRRDFCANCWERRTAAGEEAPFSFWQTIIAPPAELPKTPRQVLLDFFDNLFSESAEPAVENINGAEPANESLSDEDKRLKLQVKYLFALVMMRKKLLRLKSPVTKDNIRYLVLERFGDSKSYEVQEVYISDEELDSLRKEFSQLFEFRV